MGYAGWLLRPRRLFGLGATVAALALVKIPGLISALVLPPAPPSSRAGSPSSRSCSGVYFIMLLCLLADVYPTPPWPALAGTDCRQPAPGGPARTFRAARFHCTCSLVVTLCALVLWRIVRSPFATRAHPRERGALRVATRGPYRAPAFIIAGVFAGLAGSLYVQFTARSAVRFHWKPPASLLCLIVAPYPRRSRWRGRLHLRRAGQHLHRRWMLILGTSSPLRALRPRASWRARGRVGLRA